MYPAFPPCPDHRDWKALYRAAILETNTSVIPKRVSEAEMAVLARGRELFNEGTLEEREALEDALYALRAFRSAWEHTEAA
jgi:chloramphenicol 3-O-phosphotransferase